MGKHTPAGDQRRLVDLWRTADVSMAAFARMHGIHPTTFGAWVARHRSLPEAPTEPPRFLPLVVAAPAGPSTGMSVRVGDHVLRFDSPPPAAWFAALVRELGPC